MKVMIIGSGGREHALAWKTAQSPRVEHVYVVPGNAGTATETKVSNVVMDTSDFAALTRFVQDNGVGLTIIGPEAPLVALDLSRTYTVVEFTVPETGEIETEPA